MEANPALAVGVSKVGTVVGGTAAASSPASSYDDIPRSGDRRHQPESYSSSIPSSTPLRGLSALTTGKKGGVAAGDAIGVAPPLGQEYGSTYSCSDGSGSGRRVPRGEPFQRRGLGGGDGIGPANRGPGPLPSEAWTRCDGPTSAIKTGGEDRVRTPGVAGVGWSSPSGCESWPADIGGCGRAGRKGGRHEERYDFDGYLENSLPNPALPSTLPMATSSIPMPSADVECWRRDNANKNLSHFAWSSVSIPLTPR
ncbi:unnamed protein product, partial [Pylaiella littoralis]